MTRKTDMQDTTPTPAGDPLDAAGLEMLFAEARARQPGPSMDLMERVLGDAAETAAGFAAPASATAGTPTRAPAPGTAARAGRAIGERIGTLIAALGGWRAVTGLACCALAGFWLGFAGPTGGLPSFDLLGTPATAAELMSYEQIGTEMLESTAPEQES